MKIDIKQVILILFLLTGSLYSKSGLLELNSIKKAKNSFFLYPSQNESGMSLSVFLIQPVSFTFDSYIDFRKAFFKNKI
jgi:hypothetical protein